MRFDLFAMLALSAIVLVHLPLPFMGDQAFFTVLVGRLRDGDVLYRDVWDLKLPGLFSFYYAASFLPFSPEVRVHLLEIAVMLAFAAVMIRLERRHLTPAWAAALTPVFTIGVYYVGATQWHLTQAEFLIWPVLYACYHFASTYDESGTPSFAKLFGFGLGISAAFLTKIVFPLIAGAFWIAMVVHALRVRRYGWPFTLIRVMLPTFIGFAPLTLFVAWHFIRHDMTDVMWFTFFEYPIRLAAHKPAQPLSMLWLSARWFLFATAPLVLLSHPGVRALWQRRDLRSINLLLWLVMSIAVAIAQTEGWSHQYHYSLIFLPLGLIAAQGIGPALEFFSIKASATRVQWVIFLALIGIAFLPNARHMGHKTLELAKNRFAITPQDRMRYEQEINPEYAEARVETAFLKEPDSTPGRIFIWGEPVFLYISGRQFAERINSWLLGLMLPEQVKELESELKSIRPPYVFISSHYDDVLVRDCPAIADWLHKEYALISESNAGVWYQPRDMPPVRDKGQ